MKYSHFVSEIVLYLNAKRNLLQSLCLSFTSRYNDSAISRDVYSKLVDGVFDEKTVEKKFEVILPQFRMNISKDGSIKNSIIDKRLRNANSIFQNMQIQPRSAHASWPCL